MLKIGVIGSGYIGGVHVDSLSRIPGVAVASVYDLNTDLAQEMASRFNIPHVATDVNEIVESKDIDVIHNCTSNSAHFEISKNALLAGKQVLSEKPLAMTLSQSDELVNLAEQKRAVTGVNFCYRYYPVVQEVAHRVRTGEIGDVRIVTGTWFQDWLSKASDYSWRLSTSESGRSNITADLGSHWFDLVQFATGTHITSVLSTTKTIIPKRKKPLHQVLAFAAGEDGEYEEVDIEVEDYSATLFTLAGGVPGSFTTSQVCPGRKSDTEFQIYGSQSSLSWNHKWSDKLWIGHRDKPNETLTESPLLQEGGTGKYATLPTGHPIGYYDAVCNLLKDYYSAVATGKEPGPFERPTFQTGYDEMRIVEAALDSAEKRTWVDVAW